jgi:nuclease-like protein
VKTLGSVPPIRRRWRRTLRSGLFWTALGLGAASISWALNMDVAARSLGFDRTIASIFLALVPIPALALGVHGLALSLRLRAASLLADRTADYLNDHLPHGYVVVPHYGPRDGGDDEVAMVVIGPPGVVVVEPHDERGEVLCHEDHWYRKRKFGFGRRIAGMSPSQRARWNAARVRSDIANGGFVRTPVEPLVVFTSASLGDVSSSSVPALAGMDAMVERLVRGAHTDVPADRTRALADTLAEPIRLAVV